MENFRLLALIYNSLDISRQISPTLKILISYAKVMMHIDLFDRITDLIRDASLTFDISEKLEFLCQVKELILHFDRSLLGIFYDVKHVY